MSFPIVRLEDVITFKGGGTPRKDIPEYWDGDIPWASVKDFKSFEISQTQDHITKAGLEASSSNLIPAGHVIIPTRMALGKAAINTVDVAINQDLRALLPKTDIDSKYLLFCLINLADEIEKLGSGATVKGITQEKLYQLKIPLPPLDDQKRIAQLLGIVEGLIAQRKQHLQQLDALLKSVFLEMFGDPIINPKKFSVRKLSEFYVNPKEGTKCGPFGSALKKDEVVESGVPVWNMDNIGPSGQMIMPFRMWITKEKYDELSAYEVLDGDIVISRAGTVGKMCVARMGGSPAIISTNLIRVRLGPGLLPLHFVSLMLYCKGRVGRLKTGADGAFTHMNTGVLDSLEFPYPPIDLQNQFAAIVDKVEGIKTRYQQSLGDLEALYGALSQKAFAGELDLSRVSLPLIDEVIPPPIGLTKFREEPTSGFVVPKIPKGTNIGDRAQREAMIGQWLEAYLKQLPSGQELSTADFVDAVNTAFQSEDDTPTWGLTDQDQLKNWIFIQLDTKRIVQTRNMIEIDGSPDLGNRIVLMKAP